MKKILVLGDIMLDNYLIGSCSRISPEAPVGVVSVESEKTVLGGAGNVASNITALGKSVDIISVIGDDTSGDELKELCKKHTIGTDFIITETARPTTKKTRVIASKQQVVRYDFEQTHLISQHSEAQILQVIKDNVDSYGIIILSDYGKGVLSDNLTKEVITIAKQHNIKVLVDPKGVDWQKYSGAYLLTPNKSEAEGFLGEKITDSNLEQSLITIRNQVNLTKSIITLSEKGIAVFDEKMRIHPTQAKEVFDVSGAGDTVIASIAVKLLENTEIDVAIEFANLAAGVVVGKIGTATTTLDEIYSHQHHIKSFAQIKQICKNLRQNNKKIVFTNGCFDILHLGHIKYLEEAKKLGSVLIVGVNTDASVKRLKGESRPINPEFDRAYLLNALGVVDFVVLFDDDTPYELIKQIQPDVLVKGADYQGKEVVGSDIAKTTHLIEFVDGKSTTKIIEKIQQ